MQSHEVQEVLDLFEFLKWKYVAKVQAMAWADKKHIKAQHIRLVKGGTRKDLYVLNLIVKVAREEKETIIANREKLRSELEKTRQSA